MKSMKIVLYIVLVLLNIFLFALVVHCAVEHPSPNNYAHEFKYAKAANGNYYSIVDCLPGTNKEVEIPSSYNNLPVTHIASKALSKCVDAKELIVPDSITVIDENAFLGCDSLEKIEVDDANGFYDSRYNCNAIIERKTNALILGCKNTVIPDVVVTIGVGAFSGRKGLVSIEIPKNVKKISSEAFANCLDLTSFTVTKNINVIEERAFAGCVSLSKLEVENGNVIYNSKDNCNSIIHTPSNTLVVGCRTSRVLEGVKNIGPYAFAGCKNLKELTLPNTVKVIAESAFTDCEGLKEIVLPEGITSISNNVFKNCISLEKFNLPRDVITLGENVLFNCQKLTKITVSENNMHFDSRENCNAIVKKETNSILYGCSSTTFPSSIVMIESYAFSHSSVKEIVLPENIIKVNENAFYNCGELKKVIISNKNIIILNDAFIGCNEIEELFYKGTVDEWYSNFDIANSGNETLRDAKRYYYSETEPSKEENYWHYVNGEIVIWEKNN